jgi:hypothetical protein
MNKYFYFYGEKIINDTDGRFENRANIKIMNVLQKIK